MRVQFTLSIGISNAQQREIVEFPDDTTEEQLQEAWQDWTTNYLDGGFKILEK